MQLSDFKLSETQMDEGIDLHHVQHLVSLSSLAYKDDIIDD